MTLNWKWLCAKTACITSHHCNDIFVPNGSLQSILKTNVSYVYFFWEENQQVTSQSPALLEVLNQSEAASATANRCRSMFKGTLYTDPLKNDNYRLSPVQAGARTRREKPNDGAPRSGFRSPEAYGMADNERRVLDG